jgi:hypothetical protein
MKLPKITKKRFVGAALAAGLAMGMGGVAFAYFSTTATGAGDGDVATFTTKVTITFADLTANETPPVFPGTSETLTFTLTATSGNAHTVHVYSVTAKVTATTNGDVFASITTAGKQVKGSRATGCLASWFSVHVDHITGATSAVGVTLTPGATHAQVVTLQMRTTGTQNACQGVQPFITVTASIHS